MPKSIRHFYDFGPFRLDRERHRLLRDGNLVHLSPKSLEALIVLVENAGKLLERDELMQAVWAHTFVEDANLTVAISNLRKALGQQGETAEYIETIPRVGYRFIAEVRAVTQQPAPLIIEKHTLSQTVIEEELLPDDSSQHRTTTVVAVQPSIRQRLKSGLGDRRGMWPLGLAIAAMAFAGGFYLERPREPGAGGAPVTSIKSIAVLPPRALTQNADNAALSLGLADTLISRLGALRKVVVRPTSAVINYVGNTQDPITTGRDLGVDAVLDGSFQREHGRVRVTMQLLIEPAGNQLWSASFDENDADIFKLEDSIAAKVAERLALNLNQDEKTALTKRETNNPEAYALYLQGNYFWNKRGNEVTKSLDLFRRAIELDPNFAQAYVTLAAADATTSMPSPEAEALIDKALKLDNNSAEAHATLGFIRMFQHWDWSAAESELDRAIQLNPNSAVAHHWKGVYLSIRGRLDEAKAEMHRALELDPLSLNILADIGQLHYLAHEYDQAIDYCNRALALDPEFNLAHVYLIDIYFMKGMDREALNELIRATSSNPEQAAVLRDIFSREGLRGVFSRYFLDTNDRSGIGLLGISRQYCRLGDHEQALKWLAISVEKPQAFWTPYINVDPLYDPLRHDRRFQEMLNRMGLAT